MSYFREAFHSEDVVSSTITREVTRKFFIYDYDGTPSEAIADRTLINLDNPDEHFPVKYTSYNADDPLLKVQTIRAETIAPNLIYAECYYSYPRTRSGQNSFDGPRAHFELSTRSQNILQDLNKGVIGDPFDPDAELGMEIIIPQITMRLEMPRPWPNKVAKWAALLTKVNSEEWYGVPVGYCQYIGTEANWTGPGDADCEVTHLFQIGSITVVDDNGEKTFGIGKGVWWEYKRQLEHDAITDEDYIVRIPTIAHVVPIYKAASFIDLITA